MKLAVDIETTGLLDESSIDYSKYPLSLKPDFKVHCLVAKDIETGRVYRLYEDSLTKENIAKLLGKAHMLILHNGISYDLPVLMMHYGLDYTLRDSLDGSDSFNGKPCTIIDTLIHSRTLWPDRPWGHSLKAWGLKLGVLKGTYGEQEDAWSSFSLDMLEYCKNDVEVTEAVYNALKKEAGSWEWDRALCMEQAIAEVVFRQEHFGFKFNKGLAEKVLEDLNSKMAAIEESVEPQLPMKPISKTAAKGYIPPKLQFKKTGEPSANMYKFADKVGGEVVKKDGAWVFVYKGEERELPIPQEPIETEEPMKLANQNEMKQYLVRLGWKPTVWGENDLTVDQKKKKISDEKYQASVYRYCLETKDSAFKPFRLEHMRVRSVRELYKRLINSDRNRPVRVITSPKYTVNQDKDVCPNLEKLGSKVGFVEDVVKWLTYRHRRNSILSPKGTGFLAQPRIDVDGRIQTPAITCGAATSRMRHAVVCNIPRPTSLYGAPMRELFGVEEGCYQIGCDAAGLEARVEAHYTLPFDGEEYANNLLGEKPNDIHTITAKRMGVSRDVAKTLKYSISYGAQPPKIAKQMDWELTHAKEVFESFWESAYPLRDLKEAVERYWEGRGRKRFIKGIDGRKLYARSKHSLVNLLFQSCGVIIMKQAAVMLDRWLQEKGLLFNPFKDSSFKGKAAEMIHYHDEYQLQVCESLVKVRTFEDEDAAKNFEIKGKRMADVTHKDDLFLAGYSEVGELMSLAIAKAAEHYQMRIPFDGDYQIGRNWKECH